MYLLHTFAFAIAISIESVTARQSLHSNRLLKESDRPIISRMIDKVNLIDSYPRPIDSDRLPTMTATTANPSAHGKMATVDMLTVSNPVESSAENASSSNLRSSASSSFLATNVTQTVSSAVITINSSNSLSSELPLTRNEWLVKEYFSYICGKKPSRGLSPFLPLTRPASCYFPKKHRKLVWSRNCATTFATAAFQSTTN
jgi:hypothetical protein